MQTTLFSFLPLLLFFDTSQDRYILQWHWDDMTLTGIAKV